MKSNTWKLALTALLALTLQVDLKADDKRWYKISVTGPQVTDDGGVRTLKWTLRTDTRFDHAAGQTVYFPAEKWLSSIDSMKIVPIKDWFKHPKRKSKGDPYRRFERETQYTWACVIGAPDRNGRFINKKTVYIKTDNEKEPHVRAIAETARVGAGFTYQLALVGRPTKSTTVEYREGVKGFFSLFDFNIGFFDTEIIIAGRPK